VRVYRRLGTPLDGARVLLAPADVQMLIERRIVAERLQMCKIGWPPLHDA
jgi:hypothetical protein